MITQARWQEIARHIQEQIAQGKLRPGDRVPSERRLAAQFGYARGTAREAVQQLVQAGVLTSGNPRRVAQDRPMVVHVTRTTDRLYAGERATLGADSWLSDAQMSGELPTQWVEVITTTDAQAATRLGLDEMSILIARRNIRLLDRGGVDEPHNKITWWFPLSVAEGTPLGRPANIREGSLAWLEQKYGQEHPLTHLVRVRSRMPTHDETVALRILSGPVTVVWRTTSCRERALVTSMAVYPADRIELELDL